MGRYEASSSVSGLIAVLAWFLCVHSSLHFLSVSAPLVLCRFAPVSENAPMGTAVGVILAAAVNQTVVYSIVEGNEGREYRCFLRLQFCLQ